MTKAEYLNRLTRLQEWLRTSDYEAFVMPVTDEYQGEYSPEYARRVTWLCGFDGSAGALVVLREGAALLVDGRYTLQGAQQMEELPIAVHNSAEMPVLQFLTGTLPQGAKVLLDPTLHTIRQVERWQREGEAHGLEWAMAEKNPVDGLWEDQPTAPQAPIRIYPDSYAGLSHEDKRHQVSDEITGGREAALLLTQPDAICWLLNIRGDDIPYNPLPLCFALLHAAGEVELFTAPEKVNAEVAAHLGEEVQVFPLTEIPARLSLLKGKKVRVDMDAASFWWKQQMEKAGITPSEGRNPVLLAKACKNPVEVEGIKQAHRMDGAAVTRFLCWLDQVPEGEALTELQIVEKLEHFRTKSPYYLGPSFATIAGTGPHGAIVHYRATEESDRALAQDEVLLLDSGGQYLEGTTDITRTVVRGNAPPHFKEHFTRVLKGHIALAQAMFPEGTGGGQLDALARMPLWEEGLDYDHGTGHGVGCYLCVHEGPQRISKRGGDAPLKPGMILSNEPGYYKEGAYGIRIENLVLVESRGTVDNREFMGFRTLTLAPIDPRLVEVKLLTDAERTWLNTYHQRVQAELSPFLDAHEREWLRRIAAV